MAWLFVPGLEASNEELNESFLNAEPFALSRGKPIQPQSWSKKWKKGGFIRLLSGATCEPLMASRGVASWIGSLEDSRANPSALPGSNWEKTTPATFGLSSSESLARFDRASSSWKTFQASLLSAEPLSLQTWPTSVIVSRGRLYALPMLEPFTTVDGGSVLPTPTAKANQGSPSFQKWPSFQRMIYPTPTAHESVKAGKTSKGQMGKSLVAMANRGEFWAKPTAREAKDCGLDLIQTRKDGKKRDDGLTRQVSLLAGLNRGGRLNPEWVEWLMGWPIGWTACEPAETESCLNRQKPPSDTSLNA
jgi:hypothetical protein